MLPILGIGSLIVAAWVSVTTIDGDDPSQKSVVVLASGGRIRARMGEALAAFLFVTVWSPPMPRMVRTPLASGQRPLHTAR